MAIYSQLIMLGLAYQYSIIDTSFSVTDHRVIQNTHYCSSAWLKNDIFVARIQYRVVNIQNGTEPIPYNRPQWSVILQFIYLNLFTKQVWEQEKKRVKTGLHLQGGVRFSLSSYCNLVTIQPRHPYNCEFISQETFVT